MIADAKLQALVDTKGQQTLAWFMCFYVIIQHIG
jgi:hypothetical protein